MTKRPTRAVKKVPAADLWDDAVIEGKRLVAEMDATAKKRDETADRNNLRLGELADQVATVYKENSLGKFAAEIGMAHCTIKRRRTTYRQYKDILKSDPGLLSTTTYSVARELEKHPERGRLIKENPTMTKRQAAKLMKAYREKPESEMQRWWQNLIKRTSEAEVDEGYLKTDREILRKVVQTVYLDQLREAAQAWIRLADGLEKLFKEESTDEFASPMDWKSYSTNRRTNSTTLTDGPA
jgi:hypothetical protein